MQWLRKKRVIFGIGLLILIAVIISQARSKEDTTPTAQVERGSVERAISVSGFLEADQLVDLSFPNPGRLASLLVAEGDIVTTGTLLATTGNGALAAERQRALAQLEQAEAAREQLLNGLTLEERVVSSTTVEQARIAFETTRASEEQRLASAYSDLLSGDLEARALDDEEDIPPPQVTGSYTCETEGAYTFEIYPSSADSGYSVRYDGLESGVAPVSTVQPVVIGNCGLELSFSDFTTYNASEWIITIPNTLSETYVQRVRTFELIEEQTAQNISAAEYALRLAEANAVNNIAPPRVEAVLSANAAVIAAQADVNRVSALLADEALYAPFDGVVTNIDTTVGEVVNGRVVTLVADDSFTLIARVPEIDIRNLVPGQTAEVSFDAATDDVLTATVDYVSPVAILIDGVSYFETNLSLTEARDWFRDGLNADIDIVIEELSDVVRIPTRYTVSTSEGTSVRRQTGAEISTTTVKILLQGSDGYAAITGLAEGDVIVAPE